MEMKLVQRSIFVVHEKLTCGFEKGRAMMDFDLFMVLMKTR